MGSLFSGRTSVQTETVRWSFQCLSTEGGLDYHWESCLKGYDQQNKVGTKASKTSFTRPTFGYKQTINVASCFFPIFLSLYCFPCPPPSLTPLSASPPTQQQWAHRAWGHPRSEGVSGTELPGVDPAFPPAGFTGLQLWCADAAIFVQLGWARQVRLQDKKMATWN